MKTCLLCHCIWSTEKIPVQCTSNATWPDPFGTRCLRTSGLGVPLQHNFYISQSYWVRWAEREVTCPGCAEGDALHVWHLVSLCYVGSSKGGQGSSKAVTCQSTSPISPDDRNPILLQSDTFHINLRVVDPWLIVRLMLYQSSVLACDVDVEVFSVHCGLPDDFPHAVQHPLVQPI